MQKPNGYDEAREAGSFTPVELGGHYAVIKQVTEMQSSKGKDMIVVLFDFAKGDAQEGYHSNAFQNDNRDQKKWPFNGSKYIMVKDFNDDSKTSRPFKTFCSCFEKSNGCSVQWGGKNWGAQFKNKKIGVVYGEEEQEYDGKTSMRRVPKWFCSWDTVKDQRIPEPKYLANKPAPTPTTTTTGSEGFMNVPEGAEDEGIPF